MEDFDDQFLRISDVVRKTGRSRAAIYRMMNAGRFPRQVLIGARAVGWRLSAIQIWMSSPSTYCPD